MSKALILTILTSLFACIITAIGAKDDIKWPIWNLTNTTIRGRLLLMCMVATIILAIFSYVANLKKAELSLVLTPYFIFDLTLPEQNCEIPIYNAGDYLAKDVKVKIEVWDINLDKTIAFKFSKESRLANIPSNSTLVNRNGIPTEMITSISMNRTGILLYIEVFYNYGENTKRVTSLCFWREAFADKFAVVKDEQLYNTWFNQIIRHR